MATDAKFGLIVGIVLVIAAALLFFPKEPAVQPIVELTTKQAELSATPSAAAMLPPPPPPIRPHANETPGQTASRIQQ